MGTHTNNPPPFNDPLLQLIDGFFNGTLTPDARQRLDERLQTDSEARRLYLRRAEIEAFLVWRLRGSAQHDSADEPLPPFVNEDVAADEASSAGPTPAPPPQPVARSERGFLQTATRNLLDWHDHPVQFTLMAVALTLLLWVGFWAIFRSGVGDPQRPPVADRPDWIDGTVARLAWIDRAHWEGFVPSGRGMSPGRELVLISGFAELRYKTGASVVLQGPAEFTVGTADDSLDTRHSTPDTRPSLNSGHLAFGKLVARVAGKEAEGFTIETPTARVVDHGTEFGVAVEKSGATEAAVFEGEVEFGPRVKDDASAQAVVLRTGFAARRERRDSAIERVVPMTQLVRLAVVNKRFTRRTVPENDMPAAAVNFGTLSKLTGLGDLDLTGKIDYAINVGGAAPATIGAVTFDREDNARAVTVPNSGLGVGTNVSSFTAGYYPAMNDFNMTATGTFGDVGLNAIMRVGRNDSAAFRVSQFDVIVGTTYKIQILGKSVGTEDRSFDLSVGFGTAKDKADTTALDDWHRANLAVDNWHQSAPKVWTQTFTATSSMLWIGASPATQYGNTDSVDPNPIINAIIVTAIP